MTLHAGSPPDRARAALVLVHGRGARADDMLALADALELPADWAITAPQAPGSGPDGGAWYPARFTEPLFENEPHLTRALSVLGAEVDALVAEGVPAARVVLGGFSQGACLALEYAARHPRRFGGLLGFSGGLIGPEGTRWGVGPGRLDGTPAFLGCADADPHIPLVRVEETARVLERLGAAVTARLYRGAAHAINADEIDHARGLLASV